MCRGAAEHSVFSDPDRWLPKSQGHQDITQTQVSIKKEEL
jgi:hypothetical protein